MKKLSKYQYQLNTISPLILSPRTQNAFYKKDGFEENDISSSIEERASLKAIYPFYQYGSYDRYHPKETQYYIPGSSIKGAMDLSGNKRFLVDDIKVNQEDIVLSRLYKLQHIPKDENVSQERKVMKLDYFFLNIAVEMLKADQEYLGYFYCSENPQGILKNIRSESEMKIKQFKDRIDTVLEYKKLPQIRNGYESEEGCRAELRFVCEQLNDYLYELKHMQEEAIIILGGYKGRLLAGNLEDKEKGSIYIDKNKKLPYGLVRMKIKNEL